MIQSCLLIFKVNIFRRRNFIQMLYGYGSICECYILLPLFYFFLAICLVFGIIRRLLAFYLYFFNWKIDLFSHLNRLKNIFLVVFTIIFEFLLIFILIIRDSFTQCKSICC